MPNINELKKTNEQMVRECFYQGTSWTKNDLVNETGLSLSLTTNILQEFVNNKEIIFTGEADSTGGRKSKQYFINKDYYHILKVILLRTSLGYEFKLRSVNLLDELIFMEDKLTEHGLKEELLQLVHYSIEKDNKISTICLSVPGICIDGYIDICDFDNLIGSHLGNILEARFAKDNVLENDVNIAAIGLYHRYKQYDNLAFIYQPAVKYVGCGMIINGKLYNGSSHFAGELRYLPFYNHEIQDEMLASNPSGLLGLQIETLCCTLNPKVIGVYSDVVKDLNSIQYSSIPESHFPTIMYVDDFYTLIEEGMYRIGLNKLLERRGN